MSGDKEFSTESNNQRKHNCEKCDKQFKSKQGLIWHFDRVHDEEKGKKCNICNNKFPSQNQLNLHMTNVHENV